jgi:hypothetical protein
MPKKVDVQINPKEVLAEFLGVEASELPDELVD